MVGLKVPSKWVLENVNVLHYFSLLHGAVRPFPGPGNLAGGASDMIVVQQADGTLKTHSWPFSFGKLFLKAGAKRTVKITINNVEIHHAHFEWGTPGGSGIADFFRSSGMFEVGSFCPTPQQLASMDFHHGSNAIKFTLVSPLTPFGPQEVTARAFLKKWNEPLVLCDVDGTITKSDALGYAMPLLGRDWSQPGVTGLLSAVEGNGYKPLFLSARAISTADITRQFLRNLKQDGVSLPDGPVILSPNGLLASVYRELWLQNPHKIKIRLLQGLRELYPTDDSPFVAGFGNRLTDEVSYLHAGVPKANIFIINPKGKVNGTETYNSLHERVNTLFPPLAVEADINAAREKNLTAEADIRTAQTGIHDIRADILTAEAGTRAENAGSRATRADMFVTRALGTLSAPAVRALMTDTFVTQASVHAANEAISMAQNHIAKAKALILSANAGTLQR